MFRFGVDYYPEHWPKDRWKQDALLMREAEINTVRLAEFAWSYLEATPGKYDFEWLDQALEILRNQTFRQFSGPQPAHLHHGL